MKRQLLLASAWLLAASGATSAETIRIAIGHQSKCTDTYSAGIIVKELELIQRYLPKDGKYEDAKFKFVWKDYASGSPITNQMLANKLDFGVMGDYPLIVNGAKFQETKSLETLYVAGTGYNVHGSGNAIVVPVDSDIHTLADLEGKSISVPVGSAAWGMTLKAMQDLGLTQDDILIKNQSPPVGAANIAKGKIDAHADFCPWSEIMEFRGTGRKIFDGSEAGVPYLHGVVVRKDYADEYPEVVVAFMKAIVAAGDWVRADPLHAATMLEKWTGVEKEVQYLYFSEGGTLTLDPTIKPEWIEALKFDHGVLEREKAIPPLDFERWIDDSFIRQAYGEMGLDYEAELAFIHDPKVENEKIPPAQLWHAREGVLSYDSIGAMLAAAKEYNADGDKVLATYVYDQTTGLKLFGKVAFYVKDDSGELIAFMRKPDAEAHIAAKGGTLVDFTTMIAGGAGADAVRVAASR
jgi:NitT/TauT family transport system substrate-binding protein